MDSTKSNICALCDHARMRKDICGIYCVGGFWKEPDGSCDHYVDYAKKRRKAGTNEK